MPPPTDLERLAALRQNLSSMAVLCDLDGSLAPILPDPSDAALIDGSREALRVLAGQAGLVGFVSGRGIADLVRIVALPELTYAGNHGMEFRRPGQDPAPAPEAVRYRPVIERFAAEWSAELDERGIALEDKGVALSLHHRRAADPAAAGAFLSSKVAPAARAAGLSPAPGRMILEIRPPVSLDKGTAARTLITAAGVASALSIGDDHTDLDAWRELRAMRDEGLLEAVLTVGVRGEGVPAAVIDEADVLVDGPPGALSVLEMLATGSRTGRSSARRGRPEE